MIDENRLCPTCGQRSQISSDDTEISAYRVDKEGKPNNWAEDNLRLHNELLEKIYAQLNQLHTDVAQANSSEELLTDLKNMMTKLHPRHGLCIEADSGTCRVNEEAIKDHVLLYVDWKVPGTISKLEQARHRN